MNTQNVFTFRVLRTEINTDKDSLLGKWLRDTYSTSYHQMYGTWISQTVGSSNVDIATIAPGGKYHTVIKEGLVEHLTGFDYANHYIEMPLTWSKLEHHSEDIYDEDGNVVDKLVITNKEYYKEKYRENDTNCIVKLFDAKYVEMQPLIIYDSTNLVTNMYCENSYLTVIAIGGAYYNEPQTEI